MDMPTDRPGDPAPPGSAGGRRGRVVVGVDGSPGSRGALLHALAAAARRGADLVVVAASPPALPWTAGAPVDVPDVDHALRGAGSRARALLTEVEADPALGAVQGVADVHGRVVVVNRAASPALVAQSAGADLLVVGSRGRGPARTVLLGSVALACVTHARCPVVVVHGTGAGALPPPTAPVVVGVDGSLTSLAACHAAAREAAWLGVEVVVLTAYTPDEYRSNRSPVVVLTPELIRRWAEEHADRIAAQARLQAAAELGSRAPVIRVRAVEGVPSDELVGAGRDAALLVVGSRSRGVRRGVLLGSVALHCALQATCPVMVVHPPGGPAPASEDPP